MSQERIALVVDDEPALRELLEMTLTHMGLEVQACCDLGEARTALENTRFDLCFTDMRLPDGDGLELVREIGARFPETPIAVLTAYGSTEAAVAALKAGAFDFVSKPVNLQQLRTMVRHALRMSRPSTAVNDPSEAIADVETGMMKQASERLLGLGEHMVNIRRTIVKLAHSQAPVFISGESGTGKEVAARLIHDLSPRSDGAFVAVNCGAIPSELMESEFFGYRKGAFTGATEHRDGLFSTADGGTLFLDEVADLPLHMQVKLLRTIQEKKVRPIGDRREHGVDVRLLSATHKDLWAEQREGRFRQDLFYRINVIELAMPALRQHQEDISTLARHILEKIAKKWDTPAPSLTMEAMEKLRGYSYPGNVRELENVLERALALSDGETIGPERLVLSSESTPEVTGPSDENVAPMSSLDDHLSRIEREAIEKALAENAGSLTGSAKQLGISFRSLRYRIAKLGIDKIRQHN